MTIAATAQIQGEPDALVVDAVDGQKYVFAFEKEPSLDFSMSSLTVRLVGNDEEGLYIERDQLKEVRLVSLQTEGVADVRASEPRVTFAMRQPGIISVKGLKTADRILVVRADGKTVMNVEARQDGQLTIDLSQKPRGIYLVSVNRSFTFKLLKP